MTSSGKDPTVHSERPAQRRGILAAVALSVLTGALGYLAGVRLPEKNDGSTAPPILNPAYMTQAPDEIDPRQFVNIRTADEATAARAELIELLWGDAGLPDSLPDVAPSFLDEHWSEVFEPATRSVETLVVSMDDGLETRALLLVPRDGNGDVVILHEGHDGSFLQRHQDINELLKHGFAVVALSMPFVDPNSRPSLTLPTRETIELREHDQLKFVEPDQGHPIQYFIEPVIQILNHIEQRTDYRRTSMIGVSGGGWTTVMVAAIDPRVEVSIPVAGSFPIYLRALNDRDWGDWEQTVPEIFSQVGYLDLYVLGASGCGRRQVQVFYEYDPCCYAGTAARSFEPAVQDAASELEGSFEVVIDSQYGGHGFSPRAIETAIRAFESPGCR